MKTWTEFLELTEKQRHQYNVIKEKFEAGKTEEAIEYIISHLIRPHSLIQFAALDPTLEPLLKNARFDDLWKKHIAEPMFTDKTYPMQPRNDISLFNQAAGRLFFIYGNPAYVPPELHEVAVTWLKKSLEYGFYQGAAAWVNHFSKLLIQKPPRPDLPIDEIGKVAFFIAHLHLIPGLILQTHLFYHIAIYFNNLDNPSEASFYFRLAYRVIRVAERLETTLDPEIDSNSAVLIGNAYYGKPISVEMKYSSWAEISDKVATGGKIKVSEQLAFYNGTKYYLPTFFRTRERILSLFNTNKLSLPEPLERLWKLKI